MHLLALLAFTAAVQASPQRAGGGTGGSAMLRFGCAQTVIDRIDPYAPSPIYAHGRVEEF